MSDDVKEAVFECLDCNYTWEDVFDKDFDPVPPCPDCGSEMVAIGELI